MKSRSLQASGLFAATLIAACVSALVTLPAQAATLDRFAPIGQRDSTPASQSAAASQLTRRAVQSEVIAARAEGTLIPAGQGAEAFALRSEPTSLLSRREVKTEVIAAEKVGELPGQGERSASANADGTSAGAGQLAHRNGFGAWFARHRTDKAASGT